MKKSLSLSILIGTIFAATFCFLMPSSMASVRLSGTKSIPGDYPDLATAITDLNTMGVDAGGVTFNLVAGNPQTAPAGGYVIGGTGSLVLTTASAANPIVFNGGSNTITAPAPQASGTLNDGIFKLIGADWVTLSGFTMLENPANTTTAAGTNNMTEWGVALLYVTTTDGAQNDTIQNCTIDLNRTYQNTFGIYSNSTHSATTVTTTASATGAAGGNDNLKIYSNNITDVNLGIVHVGPTAAADQNTTVDIGGVALATGNTITNFGTTGTFSGYANVSGTVNGILVRNTRNFNVSFNTVTSSSGGVTVGTLNGIQIPASSSTPTGTLTQTINSNIISLRPGATGIGTNGINMPSGSVNTSTTVSINNNDFNTFGHTVAGATGTITFISQASVPLASNINGNTFTNVSVNTTGAVTFFSGAPSLPSGSSLSISSNQIVTGFTRTGVGATTVWLTNASSVNGSTHTINNNNFSNITLTGASAFTGISDTDGQSSTSGPVKSVNGNTFNNITTGAGTVLPMSVNFSGANSNVNNNTISNITTTNSITCLTLGSSNQATLTASGNLIDPITSGGTAVIGISAGAPTAVYSKNKIYDLSGTAAGSVVSGMAVVNSTTSSNVTLSNNLIGNLTAAAATGSNAVIGLSITGSATTATYNVFYNTVNVSNPTSGTGFGSSGISTLASATGTTSTLNLRNNIIVNTSVQNGAGLTVAYRRSTGTAGTLANYANTSNNNLFYAGTPSATNLIYSDGTSTAQTITAYRNGVFTAGTISPRDSFSVSEAPPFLSTTGASANFLHINPATPTRIESGGAPIAGITDDFDGQARNVNFPDIGADEFGGIAIDEFGPNIAYTPLGNTGSVADRVLVATITDPSGVPIAGIGLPVIYYRKNAGSYVSTQATSGGGSTYNFTISAAAPGGVAPNDVIGYYVAAQDNAGNVSVNPAGGASGLTANPPAASTPPTTPNTYTITNPPLAGDYTVGITPFSHITGKSVTFEARTRMVLRDAPPDAIPAGRQMEVKTAPEMSSSNEAPKVLVQETYYVAFIGGVEQKAPLYHEYTAEEKATKGLAPQTVGVYARVKDAVDDYNIRGVSGHTRFLLTDALYDAVSGETFPISVSTTSGDGPSASATLTIQPNTGIVSTISGSSASGIIVLADPFVKIDGDNVGGSVSRDLTVQNTGTGTNSYVIGFFNLGGTKVAKNCTVRYTNVRGGATVVSTVTWGIILNGVGGDYDNTLIENNKVWQAFVGIGNYGVAGTGVNNNGIIRNNIVGDATGSNESIKSRGIEVTQSDNLSITGNEVFGFATGNSNQVQIGVLASTGSSNISIGKNLIHDFFYNGAAGVGCFGVLVGDNSGTSNIVNNMIHNIKGDGDQFSVSSNNISWMPAGITVGANSGTLNIDYNSVYLSGATLTASFNGQSAAVSAISGLTGIKLRNNALRNSMTGSGANKTYAVALLNPGVAATTFTTINNNDYFVDGIGPRVGFSGNADKTTLGDWAGATLQDGASIALNPAFLSTTDLHIGPTSPVLAAGTTVAGITTDFDSDPRPAAMPDIGADELVQAEAGTIPAGTIYNALTADGNSLGGNVSITNVIYLNGKLSTGASTLSIGCNATVFGGGASNYVIGNLKKTYCAIGSKSFEVGTANGFSPVTVNVTAGTFPADFTAKAVQGPQPNIAVPAKALQRYWTLTATGVTADLTFSYLDPPDVPGTATEANFAIFKYNGSFSMPGGTVDTMANTASITGVTSFSDWTLAEPGADCTFMLSSTSQNFVAAGGMNSVGVTAGAGCMWTAVSNDAFITINSGTPGSGNGSVGYTVAANTGPARMGTMTIAGLTFTVTQDSGCTFMLTPTSQNFVAAGGMNSVNVTAGTGCMWTAVSNDGFITIDSGTPGSGNGTVNYTVAANTGPARMGTMTIAGITFNVTQDSGCTFMLTPTSQNFTAPGGSNSVSVTQTTSCNWTAVSNDAFIIIDSGTPGTGNGTVGYHVTANTGPMRSGTMTIAGITFTVTQDAACAYMLSSMSQNFVAAGGMNSVDVLTGTGCTWNAVSNDAFIVVDMGASGTGPGTVNYHVTANVGPMRTGTMTIAGITFTVTQDGGCMFTLSRNHQSFAGNGGSGSVDVIASDSACPWTASTAATFIHITSGTPGMGNGTLQYTVDANPGPTIRSSTITIAGETYTVYQGIDFLDVPSNALFYTEIGKLAARGVTLGCGSGNYCPDDQVLRDQMAAFIMRAKGEFNPPTPGSQRFVDVPPENVFYSFIDRLAELQITLGCTATMYCPADAVKREQMAAFIIRGLGEFNPPTPGSQRFVDVPPENPFYKFIDRMAVLNITLGCSPTMYCPNDIVTRRQMAAFLVRAFDL